MQQRQLEAFKAVMIAGSYKDAAAQLGISSPSLSALISNLQKAVGFDLFYKHKRRPIPTPEALQFYQAIEKYFVGFHHLEATAQNIRLNNPTSLRICGTQAISTFLYPLAIRKMRATYPDLNFVIECFSSVEIVKSLQSNLSTIGILPAFPERPDIIQVPLITTPHICAMHVNHPLARRPSIEVKALQGEEVLDIQPAGLCDWNRAFKIFEEKNIKIRRSFSIQNSYMGYGLINANLAVGLIEPFAGPIWKRGNVTIRPFVPEVSFDYVAAYSASTKTTRTVERFIEIMRSICNSYPLDVFV